MLVIIKAILRHDLTPLSSWPKAPHEMVENSNCFLFRDWEVMQARRVYVPTTTKV